MRKIFKVLSAAGVSLIPFVAKAQQFNVPPPVANNVNDIVGRGGILCDIFGLLFTLLIVIAVILVLWAAFQYLTAGGAEDKIKKANAQLIYAAVAIGVALLARGVPNIIGSFLGRSGLGGC